MLIEYFTEILLRATVYRIRAMAGMALARILVVLKLISPSKTNLLLPIIAMRTVMLFPKMAANFIPANIAGYAFDSPIYRFILQPVKPMPYYSLILITECGST